MQSLRIAVLTVAASSVAHAAPAATVTQIIEPAGIALGGNAVAVGYCDATDHALVLRTAGDVVEIDRGGGVTALGNIGGSDTRAAILCDGKRVVVGRNGGIALLEAGVTTTIAAPMRDVTTARTLDDGTLAFVSGTGLVTTWDGARTASWRFGPVRFLHRPALSPDGRRVIASVRGVATVFDSDGAVTPGPRLQAAIWLDNQSVLATTSAGLVRWRVGAPVDQLTVVDKRLRGNLLHAAGPRFVISTIMESQVFELDARGGVSAPIVTATRWPKGFTRFAAGGTGIGVITERDRAFLVDLSRSGPVIDDQRAAGSIRSLAFSPDGTRLVFEGGDRDLMIADIASGNVIGRLSHPRLFAGRVGWLRDGTIVAGGGPRLFRFARDRTVTEETIRVLEGLDGAGRAIYSGARCDGLPVARRPGSGGPPGPRSITTDGATSAILCPQGVVLASGDKVIAQVAVRSMTAALAGGRKRPRAYFGVGRTLHALDARGDRELATLPGSGAIRSIVASPDGRRLAILMGSAEIAIWNTDSDTLVLVQSSTHDVISGIAWAPDNRHLGVASNRRVELWTLPRPARRR